MVVCHPAPDEIGPLLLILRTPSDTLVRTEEYGHAWRWRVRGPDAYARWGQGSRFPA
jgi:hypothetical protein